jgi:single-strand DNA-binding protein
MANNKNLVSITGRLCADVELRFTPSGMAVTDLRVAVTTRKKVGDEWADSTAFVDVTVWGKQAEFVAKDGRKGSPVAVSGELQTDSWEKDGKKFSKLKIKADSVEVFSGYAFSDAGGNGNVPSGGSGRKKAPVGAPDGVPDDEFF